MLLKGLVAETRRSRLISSRRDTRMLAIGIRTDGSGRPLMLHINGCGCWTRVTHDANYHPEHFRRAAVGNSLKHNWQSGFTWADGTLCGILFHALNCEASFQ